MVSNDPNARIMPIIQVDFLYANEKPSNKVDGGLFYQTNFHTGVVS